MKKICTGILMAALLASMAVTAGASSDVQEDYTVAETPAPMQFALPDAATPRVYSMNDYQNMNDSVARDIQIEAESETMISATPYILEIDPEEDVPAETGSAINDAPVPLGNMPNSISNPNAHPNTGAPQMNSLLATAVAALAAVPFVRFTGRKECKAGL